MLIRTPIELLLPYQRKVYDDMARFKAWLSSRQTGKSFTGAGDCVKKTQRAGKTDVLIVSPSERQSYEAVLKCEDWAKAFQVSIADMLEERDAPGALMKAATIVFPNKSRIIAVPGKPDTVRGFCAHVWMDEFAFFEDPDATWRAVFPSISNPLKGQKDLFISSTANGKTGRGKRFFEIVSGKAKGWSIHKTTILDAAPYLGTNVEELRQAINDDEAWAQEYMCEFLDGSNVLLPYELIQSCEDPTLSTSGGPSGTGAQLFVGIDFGRVSDPTVCVTLELVGDVLRTVETVTLRNMSTPDQFDILIPRIRRAVRSAIDYTGPGVGFGDLVEKDVGRWAPERHLFGSAELCTFTTNFKRDIFPKLRLSFERRAIRIPQSVDMREDLHEMQQVIHNGEYSYQARRTAEGHSDRCTALALAVHAAAQGGGYIAPAAVGRRHSYDGRRI